MKILVVATFPTHPASSGNRAWILGQTEILQELGHDVHYLYVLHPSFRAVSEEARKATSGYWGDRYHEYSLSLSDKIRIKLGSIVSRIKCRSITCDEKYPVGLSAYVGRLQRKFGFDLCVVNYFYMTKLFDKVRFPKTALSTHDCFTERDLKTGDKGTMSLTAKEESKAMKRSQFIFALQEEERTYFSQLSPESTTLNVYGKFDYVETPVVGNHNMVFLGSGINYNSTAIRWFIVKVLPIIRKKYADAQLLIGGSVCDGLRDLKETPGLQLLGFVGVPIDIYQQGDVAINPVSNGTGLKIKTFESIAYGKATIVHPHSMKGIYSVEKALLFVAEEPGQWLNAIDDIWSQGSQAVEKQKRLDREYLMSMKEYIITQYNKLEA